MFSFAMRNCPNICTNQQEELLATPQQSTLTRKNTWKRMLQLMPVSVHFAMEKDNYDHVPLQGVLVPPP